jgi:hypothetical protein
VPPGPPVPPVDDISLHGLAIAFPVSGELANPTIRIMDMAIDDITIAVLVSLFVLFEKWVLNPDILLIIVVVESIWYIRRKINIHINYAG